MSFIQKVCSLGTEKAEDMFVDRYIMIILIQSAAKRNTLGASTYPKARIKK